MRLLAFLPALAAITLTTARPVPDTFDDAVNHLSPNPSAPSPDSPDTQALDLAHATANADSDVSAAVAEAQRKTQIWQPLLYCPPYKNWEADWRSGKLSIDDAMCRPHEGFQDCMHCIQKIVDVYYWKKKASEANVYMYPEPARWTIWYLERKLDPLVVVSWASLGGVNGETGWEGHIGGKKDGG